MEQLSHLLNHTQNVMRLATLNRTSLDRHNRELAYTNKQLQKTWDASAVNQSEHKAHTPRAEETTTATEPGRKPGDNTTL